ncbi:hypothetical protein [Carbonactinospora thermoautotrophica]|uniref:hypothetical protein n=1 Tax=Carbonactinospora thermoautotrophica TaxID=1469144 RepID=UPI003DA8F6D3
MNRPAPLSMARDLLDFPALGFNPAPGSVAVHEAVASLDRISQRIQEIGPRLDAEASWTGSAAEAYHAAAEQMQRRLAMRLEAVETVRQALRQWAGELATNQEEARRYEREAEEAQHALAAARDHPGKEGAMDTLIATVTGWFGRGGGEGDDVPDPSSWPKPDAGSGPWGAEDPTWRDYLTKAKWEAAATAAEAMGRTNAAHHMRHYLGNSGETLYVDPGRILRDCPDFRTAVENELAAHDAEWRRRALEEFRKNGGKPVRIPVETDWQVYRVSQQESQDWELALGAFSHKTTGVVEVKPSPTGGEPEITMRYQVNVYDAYNWNKGWGTDIPQAGGNVSDDELGRLHQVGLAREFEIKGESETMTRPVGDGSTKSPIEPPTDKRDGGRTDPTR